MNKGVAAVGGSEGVVQKKEEGVSDGVVDGGAVAVPLIGAVVAEGVGG